MIMGQEIIYHSQTMSKFKLPELKKKNLDTDYKPYQMDDETKELHALVTQRFSAMKTYRNNFDKSWDTYNDMIEAIFKPYWDDRSKSSVPLATALTELYVAEATKINTQFNIKSEKNKFSDQAKALKFVWDYDWRKQARKKEMVDNEYITAWFWHSIIYTWYESNVIKQHDADMWEDWSIIWTPREIPDSKIILKNCDPRLFYLDNQAFKGIDDANDCIYVSWESYEDYMATREWNDLYDNLDSVQPKWFNTSDLAYRTNEEKSRKGDYVQTYMYWNLKLDCYCEFSNGVLVRCHPIMSTIDWKIALPFVIRYLSKKTTWRGWRWFCEAAVLFNKEINDLREMIMDWIRRSNNPTLLVGNWLEFDWRKFSYNNEILTFNGQLSGNLQEMSGQAPNQAIFSYLDRLYKDIAVFVWIDINNILGTPQQTAYQTNVQVEASQKRVNVWLTNRDLAFERLANLHKDNLQRFFPLKDAEWLRPIIEIEDTTVIDNQDGTKKFMESKWETWIFEVTPEMLRGDIYIDVFTDTTKPPSNMADRQAKLEFAQSLSPLLGAYMQAKQAGVDIDSVLPIDKAIRELAEDFNLDIGEKTDKKELKKKALEFTDMLMWATSIKKQQPLQPSQPEWNQAQPNLSSSPEKSMTGWMI